MVSSVPMMISRLRPEPGGLAVLPDFGSFDDAKPFKPLQCLG